MNIVFHPLDIDPMALPLPERFTCPFLYEPHPLALMAVGQVQQYVASRTDWADEMASGKMLGVLVAADESGSLGFLAAFSGNLAGSVHHDFFVPPVYDLLDPQGEFKRGEAQITAINQEVQRLEQSPELLEMRIRKTALEQKFADEIADFKALMARHKQERDALRDAGDLTPEQQEALLNQSRYEKAELKRIRRRQEAEMAKIFDEIAAFQLRIDQLRARRKTMSEALQERIFRLFVVSNARGERRDLVEVFKPLGTLPPAGAGECCAPRLLNYAFNHGLKPLCMAEFWWGPRQSARCVITVISIPPAAASANPFSTLCSKALTWRIIRSSSRSRTPCWTSSMTTGGSRCSISPRGCSRCPARHWRTRC